MLEMKFLRTITNIDKFKYDNNGKRMFTQREFDALRRTILKLKKEHKGLNEV